MVEQQEEIALGGISVRIHSAYVHDFDDYYFALNPHNNHRNPWFAEFWEQRFQCNLDYGAQQGAGSSSSSHSAPPSQTQSQRPPSFIRPPSAKVYNRTCTGRESLRQNHKQDAKMAFVQKSIITMALGLDSMQRSLCGSHRPGLCPEMLPVNGSIFLQHLMNVSFSFLDEEVYFDEQGDPPGKYEILNFRRKVQPPIQTLENSATDDDFQDSSSTLLGNRPQEGSPQDHQDKNRPPNYNSYSTLKVYRAQDQAAKQQQRQLSKRRIKGQPTQTRPESQQEPARPADYSATMGYEYVHVGSWKSSDGLSLFGEIQWPSRTTIYHHYPSLSGGPPSGQAPAGPGEVTDSANSNSDPNLNQVQDNNNNISSQFPNLGLGRQATQSQSGDTLGLAGGLGGYFAPPSEQQFGQNKTVSSFKVPAPKSVCALPCAKGHAKVSLNRKKVLIVIVIYSKLVGRPRTGSV